MTLHDLSDLREFVSKNKLKKAEIKIPIDSVEKVGDLSF
jgi:sporulation protein YlmC with PRC-barrel domain